MSSEGIYVGMNEGVKQLAYELWNVPFGKSQYILGRFLSEIWKPSKKYEAKELVMCEKIVKKMVDDFNRQGHSGGSACVASQNLLSVMGCGAVSKDEFNVYFKPKEGEKIINTWSMLSKAKPTLEEKS